MNQSLDFFRPQHTLRTKLGVPLRREQYSRRVVLAGVEVEVVEAEVFLRLLAREVVAILACCEICASVA